MPRPDLEQASHEKHHTSGRPVQKILKGFHTHTHTPTEVTVSGEPGEGSTGEKQQKHDLRIPRHLERGSSSTAYFPLSLSLSLLLLHAGPRSDPWHVMLCVTQRFFWVPALSLYDRSREWNSNKNLQQRKYMRLWLVAASGLKLHSSPDLSAPHLNEWRPHASKPDL